MKLIPENALEKLEFQKVLEVIESWCFGEPGRTGILNLKPETNFNIIHDNLLLVQDAKSMAEQELRIPIRHYKPIDNILHELGVPGFVLTAGQMHQLRDQFLLIRDVRSYFTDKLRDAFPAMGEACIEFPDPAAWILLIDALLDEKGNVRQDASETLVTISRKLHKQKSLLDKTFTLELRKAREAGWLSDQQEGIRNGRRMLAVQAEHKRKIKGIIHDVSGTGKTAFVEPESVMVINNDILELSAEFEEEVYRILGDLSEQLRPSKEEMNRGFDHLVLLDTILARASYALQANAVMPELHQDPMLHIIEGWHPLLIERTRQGGDRPVPFDLDVKPPGRLVLVSGPNAGGKTVLMKATGLLQMMLQSGILIPVSPDSIFGVFKKLLVEIGDQQSLEDDLSTYSSHLQHMRDFLEEANEETLLLIDEFGSGTDPRIGGALAEAMLESFVKQKAMGVITTHYGNLKAYAYKTEAVINGAMVFDQQRMLPTYRLRLGRPGSSFAFEIARQSGLSDEVLDFAESRAGKHQRALEALLIELQEERDDLISRNATMKRKEEQLEKLIKNYESLRNDLAMQKKRWRLEKKEDRLAELNRLSNELRDAIREIRAAKDVESAERKLQQLEEKKRVIGEQAGELGQEIFQEDMQAMDVSDFKPGDHVRLRKSNATGTIERIDKQEALIHVGVISMHVPLRELRPVGKPLKIQIQSGIRDELLERKQHFNTTIDIRGLRPEEALKGLEQFFDEALMANVRGVKVIHGKGKGRLRRLVQQKLSEYPVKARHHVAPEQGGEGVTVVEFE